MKVNKNDDLENRSNALLIRRSCCTSCLENRMEWDPYLLPSNMDQCLVLTSAVTALPAVSLIETAEAAWP